MSTQDVPGANRANRDQLASGCWAEHEDGSLLFVKARDPTGKSSCRATSTFPGKSPPALSAAARVAQSLRLRAQKITEEELGTRTEQVRSKGKTIADKLQRAFAALLD